MNFITLTEWRMGRDDKRADRPVTVNAAHIVTLRRNAGDQTTAVVVSTGAQLTVLETPETIAKAAV